MALKMYNGANQLVQNNKTATLCIKATNIYSIKHWKASDWQITRSSLHGLTRQTEEKKSLQVEDWQKHNKMYKCLFFFMELEKKSQGNTWNK